LVQESLDRLRRERLVLWPEHDAHARAVTVRARRLSHERRRLTPGREHTECVTLLQRPAAMAAEAAAEVGGARTQHQRHVEAAGESNVGAAATLAAGERE